MRGFMIQHVAISHYVKKKYGVSYINKKIRHITTTTSDYMILNNIKCKVGSLLLRH